MQKTINDWSYKLGHRSLGLLLIRIALGVVFFMHGWGKVSDLPGTEQMFVDMGFNAPTGMFIAWLELIGGAAMILGFFPRFFGLAFGVEMLVALFLHGIPTSYHPHELEIFLTLVSLGIFFAGSGRYAIWSGECPRCGAYLCKMGPNNCPEMKK